MSSQLTVARPSAAEGMGWVGEAWRIFKQAPVPWMGMTAAAFLLLAGLGVIPQVGGLVVEVLSPFLVAAYMAAGQAARQGEAVNFLYLGAGFRKGARELLVVGLFYMLGMLLIEVVVRHLGGQGFQQMSELAVQPQSLPPEEAKRLLDQIMPGLLAGLLLFLPILMATWFAPALILFDGFRPMNALWWSIWACVVNWRAVFGYFFLTGSIGMLAMLIPFGLGMLVFLPIAMISTYCAYRAIFVPVGEP